MHRFAVAREWAIRSLAFVRQSGMAGCGCDLSAEGKRTMNGFALYSGANIGLKYDCGNLPKNRKKCFSCGGKPSESGKKMRACLAER